MASIKFDPLVQEIVVEIDDKKIKSGSIDAIIKKLDSLRERGVITGQQASEAFEELQKELLKTEKATDNASKGFNKLDRSLKNLSTAQTKAALNTRNYTSAANNANQVTFAFGDALQDSAQFQFGFAQGARAIGNNLAFAAEQFAITARNAGGAGQAIKALGASFFGPAGFLLAINAAITLITVFGEDLFKSKKDTDEFKESVEELSKALETLAKNVQKFKRSGSLSLVDDKEFLELEQSLLRGDIKPLQQRIKFIESEIDKLDELSNFYNQEETFNIGRLTQIQRFREELQDLIDAADNQLLPLLEKEKELNKDIANFRRQIVETFERAGITDLERSLRNIDDDTLSLITDMNEKAQDEITEQQKAYLEEETKRIYDELDARRLQRILLEQEAQKELFNIEKNRIKEIEKLEKMAAQSKISTNRIVYQSLQGFAQAFVGQSKVAALALLAIEKAAAISQVSIQGNAQAAEAQAIANKYLASAITVFGVPNPAAIAAAVNAQAQVAVIKGNTAKAIGTILATGLGQASAISLTGGSGSSGGGSGGGSGSSSSRTNFYGAAGDLPNSRRGSDDGVAITINNDISKPENIALINRRGEKIIRKTVNQ